MSFGCSTGDFIVVAQLANKIRQRFVDAPAQFKAISDEVRSLSIILQDVEVVVPQRDLTSQQKTELGEIVQRCGNVLEELGKTLDKYQELGSSSKSLGGKSRRVWKRLTWDQEEIDGARSRITSNVMLLDTFLGRLTIQASFAAKDGVNRLHERQDDQERRIILDWLTPINYGDQQSDFIGRRQAGTGKWLLNSDAFQSWLNENNQTLFCPGIPGAGKTMIISIVVEYLQTEFRNNSSVGIAYLYCNFRRQEEQKPVDLLASLLKQLIQRRTPLPENVIDIYKHHNSERTRPSSNEISKILHSIIANYSRTFIIIDALDECQISDGGRRQFLAELFNLQARTGANFLATSRFIPEIEKEFTGRSTKLEIRASDDDLQTYLHGHMLRLPSFVSHSADLQNEVKTAIIKAVDGMFLLAQLYLDSLVGMRSPKATRTALKKFPKGSEAYNYAYEEAMERVEGQITNSRDLAKQVLSWITCANRPLTTSELRHALGVEIGESELDEENLPEVEDIISVCAGLVTVDEQSNIIRLVHYTTQEYFERTWTSWFPSAQADIAITCVTYLSFDTFETGFCPTENDFETRLQLNPLYDYAARNWGRHTRLALIEAEQLILDFLESGAKVSASSQVMMAFRIYRSYRRQMPGVHLAAYFGLTEAMTALLKNGHDLDSKDNNGLTPLSWAAWKGQEAMVKLLLEKGAELESKGNNGRTPLSWAALLGGEAVVKQLLEKGAELESKDNNGWTPLLWAVHHGGEAMVKLLLEKGAELESKDNNGRTPLSRASMYRDQTAVKLLLEKGAKLESKDNNGRTPLSWATYYGGEAVIKLLLEKGAELESKDNDGRTPLSWAARQGGEARIKLLLEKGAELESRDNNGRTPLLWAAHHGGEARVQLLLEKGAELKCKDNNGQTPLWCAAANGHEAVVKLLLAKDGFDPDSKDKYGRTPLWCAAAEGHEAVVKLLLMNHSVDPDSKDSFGRTPLSRAARKGKHNVWKLLFEKYEKNGIVIREEDLTIAAPPVADHPSRISCDICISDIPDADIHHHCGICENGDFDICQECIAIGAICLDNSHKLVRCMVKNDGFVEVPD